MKFIHCSDLHLGAEPEAGRPWAAARREEIWASVGRVISDCEKEKVDLLLIAGDLFHRQPMLRELKILNSMFETLTHTRVVFICGSHDYLSPRSSYRNFTWSKNVTPLLEDDLTEVYFYGLETTVYGLSCREKETDTPLYRDAHPKASSGLHILLAHGGNKSIPIDLARLSDAGFDYAALGGRHAYEALAENMAYSGATEPLDKTETGAHGYVLGEFISQNGEYSLKTSFVPIAAREYIDLHLKVEKSDNTSSVINLLTSEILLSGAGNLYRVYLEGIKGGSTSFDLEAIKSKGMITEVIDRTVLDYDYDDLYEGNKDNIIGLFMKAVEDLDEDDGQKSRVLYYGIHALLGAQGGGRE